MKMSGFEKKFGDYFVKFFGKTSIFMKMFVSVTIYALKRTFSTKMKIFGKTKVIENLPIFAKFLLFTKMENAFPDDGLNMLMFFA